MAREQNGVVRRNADGSFTEIGTKKEMLIFRLRTAALPGGGLRIYESAIDGQLEIETDAGFRTTPNFMLRMSDDEGESWTEQEIGEIDGTLNVEGIDPTNPDRVVVWIQRQRPSPGAPLPPDTILVSDDLGATMTEWTTLSDFGGIAFGAEGEVWLADKGDRQVSGAPRGILHAASVGAPLERLTEDYEVSCLQYRDGELLACRRRAFGRVDRATGAFTASMTFQTLEQMNQCDGVDMAATCRQQLCGAYCGASHFPDSPMCVAAYDSNADRGCASPNATPASDAAAPEPAMDAGTPASATPTARDDNTGCAIGGRVGEPRSEASPAWLSGFALALMLIRSRRTSAAVRSGSTRR